MRNGKEEGGDSGYPYSDGIGDEDSYSCSGEEEPEGDVPRRKGFTRHGSVDSHAMLRGFDSPLFRRDCATVDLGRPDTDNSYITS